MSNSDQTICTCGCGGVNGHSSTGGLKNLPGLSSIAFRAGTHGSFKKAMLLALSGKPALSGLSSRNDVDLSVAALDAWATVLDVLTFYQERNINEGYLRTATERLSVIELARHISYRPGTGVAASTYLAFSMNEANGAPVKTIVPAGSKVQSIPEQDQLPQVFETEEEMEVRVEWNAIKLQTSKRYIPVYGDKEIYINGISTGLQPGDGLLMIGAEREDDSANENWDFRKVKEVIPNNDLDYTKVTWERGLGKFSHGKKIEPAKKDFKLYVFKQRAFHFGYNAPDIRVLSKDTLAAFDIANTKPPNDWPELTIGKITGSANTIMLDALYPKIQKNSWLVLMTDSYQEVYKVQEAVESAGKNFTLTAKTMLVKLTGENLEDKFDNQVRNIVVFGQPEELEIADMPITDPVKNGNEVSLEKLMPDLTIGKKIFISGKRMRLEISEKANNPKFTVSGNDTATRNLATGDSLIILKQPETGSNGKTIWALEDEGGFEGTVELKDSGWSLASAGSDDETVYELHTLKDLASGVDPTVIYLEDEVANYFDPLTVTINCNAIAATHGETREETLGSGDGSQKFQKFALKQTPLTFVSASTASGNETTLEIRVNDILWKEVSSFYGITEKEKVYTVSIDDDGVVTVQFGDGLTGSRLPTGTENVKATYRVGIGTTGTLNGGQLSMIMTPQVGLSKVSNPLDTTGAADPETLDTARDNAPLTVLTLDRIVSAKDFEDFTRAFAGIGKARSEVIWNGEKQVVHITIATDDGSAIDTNAELYTNLVSAIAKAGQLYQTVIVENYSLLQFTVNAAIQVNSDYLFEDVSTDVTTALTEAFSFESRSFGQGVTPSEVIAVIQQVEGVVYVDLEKLDGKDPFSKDHFLLPSRIARWEDNTIKPAELLQIDTNNINITEKTS